MKDLVLKRATQREMEWRNNREWSNQHACTSEQTLRSRTSCLPCLQAIWDLWWSKTHHHLAMSEGILKRKSRHWEEDESKGRREGRWDGRQSIKRQRKDGWRNIKAWGVTWKSYSETETQKGRQSRRGETVWVNIRQRAIHHVLIWMKARRWDVGGVGEGGDVLKVRRVCKREIEVLTLLW